MSKKIMWSITLLATIGAAGYWLTLDTDGTQSHPSTQTTISVTPAADDPPSPPTAAIAPASEISMSMMEQLFPADDPAWAWAKVDLEAVEKEMPENLYWEMSAPTEDQFTLDKRAEVRAHWERMHGKVLSNTGTEAEVRDYYQWRNRISADHIEFATHMIEHYGQVLPDRDLRLLELARTLHLARLEQLPRDLAVALERREAHQEVRDAWLAGEAEFRETN